jgi:hypothetical protein
MHVRVSQHAHVLDVHRVHQNELGESTIKQPRCRVRRSLIDDWLILTKLHGQLDGYLWNSRPQPPQPNLVFLAMIDDAKEDLRRACRFSILKLKKIRRAYLSTDGTETNPENIESFSSILKESSE